MALNRSYVLLPLHHLVATAQQNVLLGLRLVEKVDHFPESTEEEQKLTQVQLFTNQIGVPIDNAKQSFKQWLTLTGFEDISSSIRTALERLYIFIHVDEFLKNGGDAMQTEQQEVNFGIKANKLNMPDLLNALNAKLVRSLQFKENIETINAVRNCLVHRNGIVGDKDLNNHAQDRLYLKLRKFRLFWYKDSSEVEFEVGVPSPLGHGLKLGAEDMKIDFQKGQLVTFQLSQFVHVISTCVFIHADLEELLKLY